MCTRRLRSFRIQYQSMYSHKDINYHLFYGIPTCWCQSRIAKRLSFFDIFIIIIFIFNKKYACFYIVLSKNIHKYWHDCNLKI